MKNSDCIENWINYVEYSSLTDLNLKIRPLSTGVGFLNLKSPESPQGAHPIFNLFAELPPHAEYDLDGRHFDIGDVDAPFAAEFVKSMTEKKQTLIGTFTTNSLPLVLEHGFAQQLAATSRRKPPLILNVTSALRAKDVEAFSAIRPGLPAEVVHIGLQYHASSREAIEQSLKLGDKIVFLPQIQRDGLLASISQATSVEEQRPLWIRFDLNSLAAGEGGNFASWPTGLKLQEWITSLELLSRQCFIHGMSLGPLTNLSSESLTTRAAAQMLSFFVYAQSYRHVVSEFHGRKD